MLTKMLTKMLNKTPPGRTELSRFFWMGVWSFFVFFCKSSVFQTFQPLKT